MKKTHWLIVYFFTLCTISKAQTTTYPKITEYIAVYHTIGNYSSHCNPAYIFGCNEYRTYIPFGINVYKNPKVGFSVEIMPCLESVNTSEKGKSQSKISEVIFHPGLVFPLKHGFSLSERVAFSSSGRYGVTQILSKTFFKGQFCNYYASIPMGVRFGNENNCGNNTFFWGITLGTSF
jgi:hypothetical protein